MANVSDPEATRHVNVHVLFNKYQVSVPAFRFPFIFVNDTIIVFISQFPNISSQYGT